MFPFEAEGVFDTWNKFFNAFRPIETLKAPEILHIPVEIAETEKELLVTAGVPGFTEKELEVRAEPNRLFITGKISLGLKAPSNSLFPIMVLSGYIA